MEVLWCKKKNITSFFFNKSRFTTRLMLNLCVCVYCSDLLFVPTILSIFFFSSNKILLKKNRFCFNYNSRINFYIKSYDVIKSMQLFFVTPPSPPLYIVIACENSAIRKTRRTTRGYTIFHGKNPRKNKRMHTPKKTNGCK